MENLSIIMSSATVSAIISGLIILYNNWKNNRHTYITNERKIWRSEIREIGEEINLSNKKNISIPLTKLKMRINSYGKIYSSSPFADNHIWMTIDRLENPINLNEFNYDKLLLVDFLSLLLKSDWERAKIEIQGNIRNLVANILWVTNLISLLMIYFIVLKNEVNINLLMIILFHVTINVSTPQYAFEILLKTQQKAEKELLIKDINKSIWFDYLFMFITSFIIYFPYLRSLIIEEKSLEFMITAISIFITFFASLLKLYERRRLFYSMKYYFFSIKYLLTDRNNNSFEKKIILSNEYFKN